MTANNYEISRAITPAEARNQAVSIFLARVFSWMAIGLGLTSLTAYIIAQSPALQQMVFGNRLLFFGLIIGELVMVFYLAARVQQMSAATATAIFVGYSILNGVTISMILLIYTATSIAATFLITCAMFGSMAIYGLVTKKDLSSWGTFLFMGLIGLIIAMVVNFFLASPMMSWVISAIGVIIFTGLAAYDVQRLVRMGENGIMESGESAIRKTSIIGALSLYLDFINLFLMLLNFFGERR
ncbi:MAG: Bax inhibitor-1/YccA family protein [Deltaproteobacteria bacterium]